MRRNSRKKHSLPIWKQLAFSAVVLVIVFGSVEFILRAAGFHFMTGTYDAVEGSVIEYHWSTRGLIRDPSMAWSWIPGPNAEATQPAFHDFTYNRYGFRGPEISKQKPKNIVRIICMGDSCTLGWNAADGETWPDYLRQILGTMSPGGYQVINAGVSGFSTYQGLHDFHQRIKDWHPDILVVSYNWNDHGDAPDQVGGPALYTPSERRQFMDKDMPRSTALFELKRRFQSLRLIQAMHWLAGVVRGMEPVSGEPARDPAGDPATHGSAFPPGTGLRRVEPEDYRLNLWEFHRLARQYGIELIFLTQPANPVQHRTTEPWRTYYAFQDQYNDLMRRVARNSGNRLVDAAAADGWAREDFYDHVHTRPEANKRIAEMVSREIILRTNEETP